MPWHDRGTVRDAFTPHRVEFIDEQITLTAASPQAVADEYYDHHPLWLAARKIVGESRYEQLRELAPQAVGKELQSPIMRLARQQVGLRHGRG